ncbi:MAG: 4-hydroxythreonine-4-phosphate dehydrogenase PdxA, partial [Chloroflexi bacterium]|nr:4-hydroxythreonine-4-phosphate dehydrogenase PdxA [Chloroflexota bacterium]
MSKRPVLAVTMGDPCGIGPEVVAKALSLPEMRGLCLPLVVGSADVFRATVAQLGLALDVREVPGPEGVGRPAKAVAVLDPGNLHLEEIEAGKVSAAAGKAAMEWVELAARLCLVNRAQAMVTGPVNKEAAALAGYREIGHTELLQKLTGAPQVATMLVTGRLRVVHLTTHRSLRAACDAVTRDNILATLGLTHREFQRWGFPQPRIGVAALNPHASDGGLMGDEEAREIAPAVEAARARGIDATGPVPADIVFHQAIGGRYDVVLCMYHDQG